jgi:RHS repeat-associated protein
MRYNGSSTDPNQRAFVPLGGRILAEYYSGGTIFDHPDQIGSMTTSSDYTGNNFNEKLFYPFGEFWTGATVSSSNTSFNMHQTFAQLPDYDSETDQYNTANRYYNPTGRWLSPDPGGVKVVKLDDPQTWNMYAYVRNKPTTLTDPTGLDFNLFCATEGDTCHHKHVGIWSTDENGNRQFTATDVTMNDPNNARAGYHDQFGNQYTGTFDEQNGVAFTNTATGETFTHSRFFKGDEDVTTVMGSAAFTAIEGRFFSACGGSCEARASLYGTPEAFANAEAALHKLGPLTTAIDRLSGAHNPGPQWMDSSGYVHMLSPSGKMELHFEGHPTGVDVDQFVLHMVDAIRDKVSGRAAAERNATLP